MSEASATQKEREGLARKSSPDLEGGISEDEDPLDEYIARPAHRGFGRGAVEEDPRNDPLLHAMPPDTGRSLSPPWTRMPALPSPGPPVLHHFRGTPMVSMDEGSQSAGQKDGNKRVQIANAPPKSEQPDKRGQDDSNDRPNITDSPSPSSEHLGLRKAFLEPMYLRKTYWPSSERDSDGYNEPNLQKEIDHDTKSSDELEWTAPKSEDDDVGTHRYSTRDTQATNDDHSMNAERRVRFKSDESIGARKERLRTNMRVLRPGQFDSLMDQGFEKGLQEIYEKTVFAEYEDHKVIMVNLASLHRIAMLRLQRRLLKEAFEFKYDKREDSARFRELDYSNSTMRQYVQALTDWEFIKSSALNGRNEDPFILTTERTADRRLIQDVAEEWREDYSTYITKDLDKFNRDYGRSWRPADPTDGGIPDLEFFGSRVDMNQKQAAKAYLNKVVMAAIGGAFLIGPMLLMVLHKTLLTTLLTSSICVFAFGLLMAMFLEKPFDVLSATAAYAAVLVVFIGTSS